MSFDTKSGVNTLSQYTLLAAFAGIVLCCWVTMHVPGGRNAVVFALATVQLFPIALDMLSGRASVFAFVLFTHFMYTSLAKIIYMIKSGFTYVLPEKFFNGTVEQFYCSMIMVTTYYLIHGVLTKQTKFSPRPLKLPLHPGVFALMTLNFLTIPWQANYSIGLSGAMAYYLNCVTIVAMIACYPAGREKFHEKCIPFLGLYLVLDFLATAMMTNISIFFLIFFISNAVERKKSTIPYLLATIALFFGLQAAKAPLRGISWSGEGATLTERAELVLAAFTGDLPSAMGKEEFMEDEEKSDTDEALARLDEDTISRVIDVTPARVPFFNGSTYEQILYIMVPRFLWPNKPTKLDGNMIGRAYEVLSEDDFQTSISMPILPEAYINFGHMGLYMMAIFLGALCYLVNRLSPLLMGENYLLTFLCAMAPFLRYESDLGSTLFSLTAITMLLILVKSTLPKIPKKVTMPSGMTV